MQDKYQCSPCGQISRKVEVVGAFDATEFEGLFGLGTSSKPNAKDEAPRKDEARNHDCKKRPAIFLCKLRARVKGLLDQIGVEGVRLLCEEFHPPRMSSLFLQIPVFYSPQSGFGGATQLIGHEFEWNNEMWTLYQMTMFSVDDYGGYVFNVTCGY